MKVKQVERKDNQLIILLSAETGAYISVDSEEVKVKYEKLNIRDWGYFEDLKITINNPPDSFSFFIKESEWGRKGRVYLYKIVVCGENVSCTLQKESRNGYYSIVGIL